MYSLLHPNFERLTLLNWLLQDRPGKDQPLLVNFSVLGCFPLLSAYLPGIDT